MRFYVSRIRRTTAVGAGAPQRFHQFHFCSTSQSEPISRFLLESMQHILILFFTTILRMIVYRSAKCAQPWALDHIVYNTPLTQAKPQSAHPAAAAMNVPVDIVALVFAPMVPWGKRATHPTIAKVVSVEQTSVAPKRRTLPPLCLQHSRLLLRRHLQMHQRGRQRQLQRILRQWLRLLQRAKVSVAFASRVIPLLMSRTKG